MPERQIDDLLQKYSLINGKYHQIIWLIYSFVLKNQIKFTPLLNNQHNLMKILLEKFQEIIDLISPHFLSSIVKCVEYFIPAVISKESSETDRQMLNQIYLTLFKNIWEIKEDVRNFSDAYNEYLIVLFNKTLIENDHDNYFKSLIKQVKEK